MAENDTSMRANGPSISGVSAVKPFVSSLISKKRGKSRRKNLSASSKAACLPPDLDIVSGFAFLSFSSIEELECHIEDHEVNTRSLSINVGGKRKKSTPRQQKNLIYTANDSDFVHSKRIRTPSQKVLESYATANLNLYKVKSNVSRELKQTKIRPFPGMKATSTNSSIVDSNFFPNSSDLKERDEYFTPPKVDLTAEESNASEISLECSGRIGLFEPKQEVYPSSVSVIESVCSTAIGTEVPEKRKKKKRKRDKSIHDQTCQTMFRIKKKKKDIGENTVNSIKSEEKQIESPSSFLKIEEEKKEISIPSNFLRKDACQPEITKVVLTEHEKVTPSSATMETDANMIEAEVSVIQVEDEIYSPAVPHLQTKRPNIHDLKVQRIKVSNKVEKIDYCARSGGVSLVERHHERQNKYKQDESSEDVSFGQQLPSQWENDSRGSSSCDINTGADNLSENSGNDSSNNSSYGDQEAWLNLKSRIFSGSSSVFINSLDESNDTSDIDIESNEPDANKPRIDIVKALPKSYLFGHLSSFPDKTTKGTIDVSIQVYENDIQLYMNYAADFEGRIIKIIIPDNEDSKSSCYLKSSYLSGLPKFLQPQEYVKAVRSATERNRRHTIGDLFYRLKVELFNDVRDYYFSKQAILTKAIETLEQYEVEGQLLESEKNIVGMENKELRSRLNSLLFGKDLDDDKLLDLNKVTEHLRTLGIEVEIPPEESSKDGKISQETEDNKTDDTSSNQQKKHITRKGRPPSEGKLLKSLQTDSQAKLPKIPKPRELSNYVKAAFNNKMKEFVAIAPSDNIETPSVDQSTDKEAPKTSSSSVDTRDSIPHTRTSDAEQKNSANDSSVNKIVCNLTKYRVHQKPHGSGTLTIVTKPEPLKGIESKNVVHIKISNDTMKQVNVPSISAVSTNSKNSVPPSTNNIENEQTNQEDVGAEVSASCNTKELQGTSKPTNRVFTPLVVGINSSSVAATVTKGTFVQRNLEALTPEDGKNTSVHLASSKNKVILEQSKEETHGVDDNQSQAKVSETENMKKRPEGIAEESAASSSIEESLCPEGTTKDKVQHHGLIDTTVSKEVTTATEQAATSEGSKDVSERGTGTTTTSILAKPQCSPQVNVSQTVSQHQTMLSVQEKHTANRPLQEKPLITFAKMQQNQMVPIATTKQVVTAKINAHQTLKTSPMTAKSTLSLSVLKLKQLRPAPSATQRNVTLIPMTANTMATQGTTMLQMTPTTLTKGVTSKSISMLPTVTTNVTMLTHSTGMVQMIPSMANKLVTPRSIAVLPLSGNVTMATHSTAVTKLVTTAAPQSITVLPMGTKGKPIIQVPQATGSKVALQQGISVRSPTMTQPPASGYVTLVHTPSSKTPALNQKTFIVPSSSLSGTAAPFKLVFKPTSQPQVFNTPFPQIKGALQSSNVIGLPNAKTAPIQQSNTSVSTSMTTHPTGTLNTKVVFQDKVPVSNKQGSLQNTGNTTNVPVQYRQLIMKAPPVHVASVSQPTQTKTLVRVQQATSTPILSSMSPGPEQQTKAPMPLTELVHLSSEGKDFVIKPSTTIGIPVLSTASSLRQLLVSGPVNTQVMLQDPPKPSSMHSNVHTSLAAGSRSMATFNIAVPQSGSLQNSTSRLVSHGNKDKDKRLPEAHVLDLTPKTTPASVGSKETFSEIEKILAKIPLPKVTNSMAPSSGNTPGFSTPTSDLRLNIANLSCPQNLDYSMRSMNKAVSGNIDAATAIHSMERQVFNIVVGPQKIADTFLPQSQMITSSTKSLPVTTSVSPRDRIPCTSSPTLEVTRSTSVSFSSTCISTAASFDDPKPKGDKTCSVVDSPEVVSHMVSADTLSVCNIDSSIPDIAGELSSQIDPASHRFSSLKSTIKEWSGNKETLLPNKGTNKEKKSGPNLGFQDESTAEDFDLLSTFKWNNNNAPNESSAVISSGHAYKTGDT
ncbi:mucin-3A-like [Actinia tenebrosa]|uniref:Mucin-3A-like n=1 Tax=Actinia tenebrosa TaxID=6105 RepID=A0A6P8HXL4_ACTTE|nr:mucin-3A-like [Actinia tenebrosa]